jgi:hypothetical protein
MVSNEAEAMTSDTVLTTPSSVKSPNHEDHHNKQEFESDGCRAVMPQLPTCFEITQPRPLSMRRSITAPPCFPMHT